MQATMYMFVCTVSGSLFSNFDIGTKKSQFSFYSCRTRVNKILKRVAKLFSILFSNLRLYSGPGRPGMGLRKINVPVFTSKASCRKREGRLDDRPAMTEAETVSLVR